jgi:hypothetical protein
VSILSQDKMVIGLFDSDIDAEKTVDKLYQVGFGREAEDETIGDGSLSCDIHKIFVD